MKLEHINCIKTIVNLKP